MKGRTRHINVSLPVENFVQVGARKSLLPVSFLLFVGQITQLNAFAREELLSAATSLVPCTNMQ
jgi:hypothetical protein